MEHSHEQVSVQHDVIDITNWHTKTIARF